LPQFPDQSITGPRGRPHQHDLAGARGGRPEPVDLLAVGVRAADGAQQQGVTSYRIGGQVAFMKEQALAGAAAPEFGSDLDGVHPVISEERRLCIRGAARAAFKIHRKSR
jgi:hypothetical protein